MTPQEWIAKYRNYPLVLKDQRVLFFATTGTMAEMSERIWGRGELSDGRKLTYKENYRVWGYPPRFFNQLDKSPVSILGPFSVSGVPFNRGEWFPTYLTYKEANNRGNLPFELTSNLRISWGGGAQPGPVDVSEFICQIKITDYDAKKVKGLVKQKGEFLRLTRQEEKNHHKRVADLFFEETSKL
jgi:hypothetical protein